MQNGGQGNPLRYRGVERHTLLYLPHDGRPILAFCNPGMGVGETVDLAVLLTRGRRIELELRSIDRQLMGDIFRGHLLDHPVKSDVRQPRLIFRVAATNVGVIARKPHLDERLVLLMFLLSNDAVPTPFYPVEIGPSLVDLNVRFAPVTFAQRTSRFRPIRVI